MAELSNHRENGRIWTTFKASCIILFLYHSISEGIGPRELVYGVRIHLFQVVVPLGDLVNTAMNFRHL